MGINKDEEYFPRGRPASAKPALRRDKDSLFKKHKAPRRRKNKFKEQKQSKQLALAAAQAAVEKSVIKPLTYQALEEGMVIMGRVREVLPFHMFICLPGRLSAKVPISAISEPYTDSLAKLRVLEVTQEDCPPLSELFSVGQPVVCSVVEVKKEGDLLAVSASLDPSLVNKERTHHSVKAGHVIVAAVRSVEDHGYTLHTGIGGLTAFLRTSNTESYVERHNHGRPIVVGEILRCLVTKCVTSRSASRAEVTVDPETLARTVLKDVTPQALHPATTVKCTVDQVVKNGLVVTVGQTRGYVEAAQLAQSWTSTRHYQPQSVISATVLYQLPITDFQNTRPIYLTLKSVLEPVTPSIPLGEVMPAKITGTGARGVYLCLGEKRDNTSGNKGFVSVRRLGVSIDKGAIIKTFPKGKQVATKILGYDYMEQVYNCSLERSKLEQQYVSLEQLRVGDRVSCLVTGIEDIGLWLSLGSIRLYVFKRHTADVPYSNLYHQFRIGDIVDGRVLTVVPETRDVTVTLKETLICSPALTSYEEARLHDSYWGTVRSVLDSGLLVTFYNNVTGLLPVSSTEPHTKYTPGQLVKCYITYVNAAEEKLTLSLTPKESVEPQQLTLGNLYQLVVSQVQSDHLLVSACDYDGVEGIIPKNHVPDCKTHRQGNFFKGLLYMNKSGTNYFSPHPAMKQFFKVDTNIKPYSKVTCVVASIDRKKIVVHTHLSDFRTVEIPKKKWTLEGDVTPHQIVKLYVEHLDTGSNTLKLSCTKHGTPPDLEESVDDNSAVIETEVIPNGNEKENVHSSHSNKTKKDKLKKSIIGTQVNNGKITENNSSTNDGISTKRKRKHSKSEDSHDNTDDLSGETGPLKKKLRKSTEEQRLLTDLFDYNESAGNKTPKSKKKKSLGPVLPSDEIIEEKSTNKEMSDFPPAKNKNKKISNKNMCNEIIINKGTLAEESDCGNKGNNKQSDSKTSEQKGNSENSDEHGVKRKSTDKEKKGSKRSESMKEASEKLTLSETGFMWDVKPEDLNKPVEEELEEEEDQDVDDAKKGKKKKTAAERRKAAKEEEARLREVEQTLLDSESNPQSVNQFDRAVLARPDDGDLWIKYMSYHLQATEIEKARAVARRALHTINQRHEVDRLNVWIALLNLENLFGNQESLKTTLDEALRTNDEFTVYCKMLQIYTQANKAEEAEQLVNTMLRKFRNSPACWVQACSGLMQCGLADKARHLLQRAITALPTKDHVNLLCKFALLENQHGYSEQAQTLFEHILTSYPRRTDVWSVYVDMLVKTDRIPVARQILERASRQKLPPRKMKMLFSKWVSFEEKHGGPEKVEHVRKQALEYVNNITMKLE